jgi:hypothetical protein
VARTHATHEQSWLISCETRSSMDEDPDVPSARLRKGACYPGVPALHEDNSTGCNCVRRMLGPSASRACIPAIGNPPDAKKLLDAAEFLNESGTRDFRPDPAGMQDLSHPGSDLCPGLHGRRCVLRISHYARTQARSARCRGAPLMCPASVHPRRMHGRNRIRRTRLQPCLCPICNLGTGPGDVTRARCPMRRRNADSETQGQSVM